MNRIEDVLKVVNKMIDNAGENTNLILLYRFKALLVDSEYLDAMMAIYRCKKVTKKEDLI